MERLTTENNKMIVLQCCVGCDDVGNCVEPCCDYWKAIALLAAYEDTDLTPEEVAKLKEASHE